MRHLKNKVAAARKRIEEDCKSNLMALKDTIKEEDVSIKEEANLPTHETITINAKTLINSKDPQSSQNVRIKIKEEVITTSRPSRISTRRRPDNGYDHEGSQMISEGKELKGATSAKNIIKNYGRALQNFATSHMVVPYLLPKIESEQVSLKDFRKFFYSKKKQVRSIAGLRSLLLITPGDDRQTAAFKKIFREISIIFIKFFSVNWIFSGKLLNKIAHLKCRYKMLRRIKNPETFTYLKGFL